MQLDWQGEALLTTALEYPTLCTPLSTSVLLSSHQKQF